MLIALTGKSCSGKNQVGAILQELGLQVWDLDNLAHDGLKANANAIISAFGPEIVHQSNGATEISRRALSDIVFKDSQKRTQLESILYPWIKEKILAYDNEYPSEILVINGALIYRSGLSKLCSCVIFVDAPYQVRLQRAIVRDNLTEDKFALRENSQFDVDYRDVDYGVPLHVLRNDEPCMDKLRQQVFNIYRLIQKGSL